MQKTGSSRGMFLPSEEASKAEVCGVHMKCQRVQWTMMGHVMNDMGEEFAFIVGRCGPASRRWRIR